MRFTTHRVYEKQSKKLTQEIRDKMQARIALLHADALHPLLNNHKLHHPWDGYSSINITGDWRLIYKKLGSDSYYLRAVGTHHQLSGT